MVEILNPSREEVIKMWAAKEENQEEFLKYLSTEQFLKGRSEEEFIRIARLAADKVAEADDKPSSQENP